MIDIDKLARELAETLRLERIYGEKGKTSPENIIKTALTSVRNEALDAVSASLPKEHGIDDYENDDNPQWKMGWDAAIEDAHKAIRALKLPTER